MHITIHMPSEFTESQQAGSTSEHREKILDVARQLEVTLRATHPGATDPALAATFTVQANDSAHARQIVEKFRALGADAYLKPPESLP